MDNEKKAWSGYLGGLALALALAFAQGCAATGTKSVDLFGLVKWDNFAGQKLYAGYENIDEVDERRGVNSQNFRTAGGKNDGRY